MDFVKAVLTIAAGIIVAELVTSFVIAPVVAKLLGY